MQLSLGGAAGYGAPKKLSGVQSFGCIHFQENRNQIYCAVQLAFLRLATQLEFAVCMQMVFRSK
jgi:hypothetical protein